jgi:hypothetical protein
MVVALNKKHWLLRARQARTTAGWMADPDARSLLIEIAERYEQLARMPAAYTLKRSATGKEDK